MGREQSYFNQPALSTTANARKIASNVQLMRLSVCSALRALLNIEPPLAASPPMPSPLGLCSNTEMTSRTPLLIQIQETTELSMG